MSSSRRIESLMYGAARPAIKVYRPEAKQNKQHVELDRAADPRDRVLLQELIGEGTYGEVYCARDKKTGRRVAVKHVGLDRAADPRDRVLLQELIGEGTYAEVYCDRDKKTDRRDAVKHVELDRAPDPRDRVLLQELIGEGTYGEVYCARDKKTGRRVALKISHGLSQHVELDRAADPRDRVLLQELIGESTYGEVYCARDKKTGRRVAVKVSHGLSQHVELDRAADPWDRVLLQELIGEGTYGEVFCTRDKKTGRRVAVKVSHGLSQHMELDRAADPRDRVLLQELIGEGTYGEILENIAENIEEIEEEFLVFRDLSSHPNIPEFFGLFLKRGVSSDDDQIWFVMELCTGGSVTDLCAGMRARGNSLTEPQLAYVLRGTVRALTHLHAHRCMHRDVKGHNILLTEDAEVKLVDFGVSSHLAATAARRNTSVGTPYWMAPEVIACEQQLDESYDCRCDVWSVGITAIELAEGEPPLSGLHPMRALFQIPRNPPPMLSHPEIFSPQLSDFVADCLIKDMNQRPFARELLEHPLLLAVSSFEDKIRKELQAEIKRQRAEGRCCRAAEATTKRGKLKSHRKARPEKMYTDDLATLEVLTEEAIVDQLQKRYTQNQIYTYIGDILVAVNPFTDVGIYTTKSQQIYQGRCRSDNPPHIFAVADAAHQALMHQKLHQAIVISGESGAGKTESANLLLKQLVFLSKTQNRNLEEKILQMNPIMESFGNARTGINANSSRFGKYLDLSMMRAGRISGTRISVYLLEQSRVVHQALGESNFHVFYYLYDGLETILHLGDIEFGEADDHNADNRATIIDTAPLHRASCLLGVETSDLRECLTSSSVVARGETIARYSSPSEAAVARDATARGLYARAFDRIVERINALLCQNRPNNNEQQSIGILDIFGFENFSKNSFEQLCINIANEQIQYYFNQHIFTWEQQEYMAEGVPVDLVEFSDNRPVLDMLLSRPIGLLALLDEESRFPRATDRSLIEKFHNNVKSKYYVRPKSDAICFAVHHFAGRVVYQADGFLEKNRNFLPPEVVQLMRQSQYDIIRFLFQCPITKTGNLYSPLHGDEDSRSLESPPAGDSRDRFNSRGLASQSRAQQTVSTYFRYSLMELLQKMVSGTPQFVRCLKPNESRSPKHFDSSKILKQLRYTGVLETIRIRQNGFSHRLTYDEFLKRYGFLAFSYDEVVKPSRDTCRMLLMRLKMDGWALGKSKVFLKYYHVELLARIYEEQVRKVILVQACARAWLARLYVRRLKAQMAISVLTLQRHVRGWITRKRLQERQRQLAREFQREQDTQRKHHKQGIPKNKAMMKAKVLRRMTSVDSDSNETHSGNKENIDTNKAAVVHNKNQEVHKNLRRNKPGIRLKEVLQPPDEYRPPPGFTLVPAILRGQPSQVERDASRLSSPSPEFLESPARPWDEPLKSKTDYEIKSPRRQPSPHYEDRHLVNNQNWQNLPRNRQCGGLVSNKINELVRNSQRDPTPRPAYNPAPDPERDLRKILRNSPEILATPVFSSDDDYTEGPFRFKQLLRPTLGPTESLRKRKVRNSPGQSPWMSDSSQDSTNGSKQAFCKRRPQITNESASSAACARTRAVASALAMAAAAGLPELDFTQIKTRSIERTLLPLIKQRRGAAATSTTGTGTRACPRTARRRRRRHTPDMDALSDDDDYTRRDAQISTLVTTRGDATASGVAVQRVGAAVCCAVERFVAVGETIADDNPDVRHSMVLACKDARAAGK
ncbi:putative myosin IIIA [Operophtera brumata]|uniref:non-specific serine/threonine protein kinase n=1 Tax=Operophtera brumata TaxID=104452 RepID=A0A0L7LG68_OPEBR|nr:putative myosin IIIA [Operophtera brumata]